MRPDAQIQADVIAELNWTPEINASDIGVAVLNGIVTLTGTVTSYSQKAAANKAAARVDGVRAIAEDIRLRYELGRDPTDEDIAEAALNALNWNTAIDASHIQVEVDDGALTLNGQVDWEFQRAAARCAVEHLAGVKWVCNNLRLKPVLPPDNVQAEIVAAIRRNVSLNARDIHVTVMGSTVVLTGKVKSLAEKYDAAAIAWSAPGINEVDNLLEVVHHSQLVF